MHFDEALTCSAWKHLQEVKAAASSFMRALLENTQLIPLNVFMQLDVMKRAEGVLLADGCLSSLTAPSSAME